MGGNLTLESTPGKGSVFRMDLPLRISSEKDVVQLAASRGQVTGLAPGQPDYRVLIVEDQLENQLLLTQLMKNAGIQVKVANDGKEGIALFQSWHPQLIWMDRRLPVMDGLEATRAIRQLPDGQDVKIIAVTASAFIEQRGEMLQAGMNDFLRKPYREHEIYECMSRNLGVQFSYRGAPQSGEAVQTLTPQMLQALPESLRTELKAALESLENKRIAQVIGQIGDIDRPLQNTLTRLAENFDYPAILKALGSPSD